LPTITNPLVNNTNKSSSDSGAVVISDVSIKELSYTSAIISWKTNVATNSLLAYGVAEGQPEKDIESGKEQKTHKIALTNLEPGINYYFTISATAGSESAQYTSEFTAVGLPVKATILSADQEPIKEAEVTIDGNVQTTSADGVAYFALSSGEHEVFIVAGSRKQQFDFTVDSQAVGDAGVVAEEQSVTFIMSSGSIAGTAFAVISIMLVSAAAGYLFIKRRARHPRAARKPIAILSSAKLAKSKKHDVKSHETPPTELEQATSPLVNPVVVQPSSANSEPTLPVIPPLPQLPLEESFEKVETQQPVPEQSNSTAPKPIETVAPTSSQSEALPAMSSAIPIGQATQTTGRTTSDGHHVPQWQAEVEQKLAQQYASKANNPEDMGSPPDMFDTAEAQYHYDQKFKKLPKA